MVPQKAMCSLTHVSCSPHFSVMARFGFSGDYIISNPGQDYSTVALKVVLCDDEHVTTLMRR